MDKVDVQNIGKTALEESSQGGEQLDILNPQSNEIVQQAGQYLPSEMTTAIQDRMAEIIDVMTTQTIGEKPQDELTSLESRNLTCLDRNGIGRAALSFTSEELALIADYVRDTTPEIVEDKIGRIHNVINRTLNGVRKRRDYYPFDQEKGSSLLELNAKRQRWEEGDFEGKFFDEEALLGSIDDEFDRGEVEYDLRNFRDDPEELREYLDAIGKSEHMLVYGPYTEADLDSISEFAWPTFISPINQRLIGKRKVTRHVKETVGVGAENEVFGEDEAENQQAMVVAPMHELNDLLTNLVGVDSRLYDAGSLEEKLNIGFAVEQIAKNRSLGARNGIGFSAGFAQAILDKVPDVLKAKIGEKDPNSDKETTLSRLRRRLDLISKFAGRICGFSEDYLKQAYGSTRPITKEFFAQCVAEAGSWTKEKAEMKDTDFLGDITSMSLWTEVAYNELEEYFAK